MCVLPERCATLFRMEKVSAHESASRIETAQGGEPAEAMDSAFQRAPPTTVVTPASVTFTPEAA